ncbi:unnamed protein product [Ambrosiozyma monospora]|uniref:Unnamed protein product n=1 Tax=Ambrosiozyma monospora TaxID=43982 RepID=A0ACB5U806_AMBMO|nr:unnamed protein product [Ambrosiozyma monospora]
MLDKKQQQLVDANAEISKLTSENRDLRNKFIEVESSKEQLASEVNKSKFAQSKLQQDLDLSKQNSTWFETELKNKTNDLQLLREQKRDEVSKLQTQLEKYKQNYI